MSADLCGNCGRAVLPAGVDELEAAIRTLRMLAEDGEPRALAALGITRCRHGQRLERACLPCAEEAGAALRALSVAP